jgi:hypothetical protein
MIAVVMRMEPCRVALQRATWSTLRVAPTLFSRCCLPCKPRRGKTAPKPPHIAYVYDFDCAMMACTYAIIAPGYTDEQRFDQCLRSCPVQDSDLLAEVSALLTLDHPHIVRVR